MASRLSSYFLVDLHEVREVRPGQRSKDFEKRPKESADHKKDLCFVLYYGYEFRLKTFSVVGK